MATEGMLSGPDNGFLMIPLEKQKLGNFLTSLLGQPQTIDRKRFGAFDIDTAWIRSLLDSIHLHITRQVSSKRITFSAEINYSDGEVRRINSYEELVSYNEVFKRYTLKLRLFFSYLIEFPDKDNPEREDFEFVFDQLPSEQEKAGSVFYSFMQKEVGYISYRINYTERTWGDSIDKLVADYITKAFVKESRNKSYFKLAFSLFSLFIASLCMYSPLLIQQKYNISMKNELIDRVLLEASVDSNSKLESMFEILTYKEPINGLSLVHLLIGLTAGVGIMFFFIYLSKKGSPSFIVLTDVDAIVRRKALEKSALKRFGAIGAYILSLLAGVISNYVFMFINSIK